MSFVDNSINFLKTLPDLYSNNVKHENKHIQNAIDWAPSLIMASGMIFAPYTSLALGILTVAGHYAQPEIITSGLVKNVLFAAALSTGAKSILPVTKALLYSTSAIVSLLATVILFGVSVNFDELVEFAKLLKDKKFDKAKTVTFEVFDSYTKKLLISIENLSKSIADQFNPAKVV